MEMDKLLIYYISNFYIYHAHAPVCTIIYKSRLHKYAFIRWIQPGVFIQNMCNICVCVYVSDDKQTFDYMCLFV